MAQGVGWVGRRPSKDERQARQGSGLACHEGCGDSGVEKCNKNVQQPPTRAADGGDSDRLQPCVPKLGGLQGEEQNKEDT